MSIGLVKDVDEPIRFPVLKFKTQWTGYKKMKSILLLKRKIFTNESTIGDFLLDDQFQCHTLEDTVRKEKIPGITAIPFGTYEVVMNYSNRFKMFLPLLLNVPDFKGIRIHAGNRPKDTDGCILVGKHYATNCIWESKQAFDNLMMKLEYILRIRKIYITIKDGGLIKHEAA